MSDNAELFAEQVRDNVSGLRQAQELRSKSIEWIRDTAPYKYTYNFSWLGRPIIQFPQDMVAIQELIWSIKPQVIVETGIAHGGSLIFHASILELIGQPAKVVGVDIDIRKHNREALESHPLIHRIDLVEGSSIDQETIVNIRNLTDGLAPAFVILDSNHTHDHVLAELDAYSSLVDEGSYVVVLDTVVDHMPDDMFPDRPWGPGNNPNTAVQEFLAKNKRFEIDSDIEAKMLITSGTGGYLKCISSL